MNVTRLLIVTVLMMASHRSFAMDLGFQTEQGRMVNISVSAKTPALKLRITESSDYKYRVEVSGDSSPKPIQTMKPAILPSAYKSDNFIKQLDLDSDGYQDLLFVADRGSSGHNEFYDVWLYDPKHSIFVHHSEFLDEGADFCNLSAAPDSKEIVSTCNEGGSSSIEKRLRSINGKWVVVRQTDIRWKEHEIVTTVRELKNKKLVIVNEMSTPRNDR